MSSSLAIKVLALSLLLGVATLFFLLARDGAPVPADERPPATMPSREADAIEPDAPLAPSQTVGDAPDTAARVAAVPHAQPPPTAAIHGELAGLTGRVVEVDGTPVPDFRVALLELDTTILFFDERPGAEAPASLVLAETTTDREGRFLLGGARAPAFHGLGLDLGGPRASLRVVEAALVHRRRADLGDVVLDACGIVTGRVVGEDGAPVARARVRLGPFPRDVLGAAPWELRQDSLIAVAPLLAAGVRDAVVELPDWIRGVLDRLPVPTAWSAADGTFRLEGVALAELVGGVDLSGRAGLALGPLDLTGTTELHLGDLVLPRGRIARGRVVTTGGDPASGVEVFAGAEVPLGDVAILQRCASTGADGRFARTGVPPGGQLVVAARRAPGEPWIGQVASDEGELTLVLPATIALTVRVQDEAGAPVSGASLRATQHRGEPSPMGLGEMLRFLPASVGPNTGFRETEPGRYEHAGLTAGDYDLTAHVAGHAPGRARVTLPEHGHEVVVVATAGTTFAVLVVDAATGAPVEGADVRLLRAGEGGFLRLASASTTAGGRARLGPVSLALEPGEDAVTILVVRHPRYADHSAPLDEAGGETRVELEGGGTLAGRVHLSGAVPAEPYMLLLVPRDGRGFLQVLRMPRFGLSDLEGAFRFEGVPGGEYDLELVERFLDRDVAGLLDGEFEPAQLHRQRVTIESGRTTEVEIDLGATGRGPVARLQGRVSVDGRSLEGARVHVRSNGTATAVTDAAGWYDTGEFSLRDETHLTIEGDVRLADGPARRVTLSEESFELRPGELRRVDVDAFPLSHRVQVVEAASGAPIAGALVTAYRVDERHGPWNASSDVATDASGEVSIVVLEAGMYMIQAKAEGRAEMRATTQVGGSEGASATELRLSRAVPCAGRVAVEERRNDPEELSYLQVYHERSGQSAGTVLVAPDFAFDLDGLGPGDYRTWIYVHGRQGEQQSFTLGPDGDRNLILEFIPEEE